MEWISLFILGMLMGWFWDQLPKGHRGGGSKLPEIPRWADAPKRTPLSRSRHLANARRIVTAVNCHDELLAIANYALFLQHALASPMYQSSDIPVMIDEMAEMAQVAIAKAEGDT